MIRMIWRRLRSWIALRRVTYTERMVIQLEVRLKRNLRVLERKRKRLRSVERRLTMIAETIAEDMQEAEVAQRRYEEAMEALRSECRIYREVTVPNLVAQDKLLLARYDALTAIETQKRIAVMPGNE